jgi:hypothetical protein
MTAMGYRLHSFIKGGHLTVDVLAGALDSHSDSDSDSVLREACAEQQRAPPPRRSGLREGDACWVRVGGEREGEEPFFLGDLVWPSAQKLIAEHAPHLLTGTH